MSTFTLLLSHEVLPSWEPNRIEPAFLDNLKIKFDQYIRTVGPTKLPEITDPKIKKIIESHDYGLSEVYKLKCQEDGHIIFQNYSEGKYQFLCEFVKQHSKLYQNMWQKFCQNYSWEYDYDDEDEDIHTRTEEKELDEQIRLFVEELCCSVLDESGL